MRWTHNSWAEWDAAVAAAGHCDVLASLSDETIIELIAKGDPKIRRYELDLLATELANRIDHMRRAIHGVTDTLRADVPAALASAEATARIASASERTILDHIEARQDRVADEPDLARQAAQRAKRTRARLEEMEDAKDDMVDLDAEARRHARTEDSR